MTQYVAHSRLRNPREHVVSQRHVWKLNQAYPDHVVGRAVPVPDREPLLDGAGDVAFGLPDGFEWTVSLRQPGGDGGGKRAPRAEVFLVSARDTWRLYGPSP
jgi:hypothetical protein